jgi:hypothetical protein
MQWKDSHSEKCCHDLMMYAVPLRCELAAVNRINSFFFKDLPCIALRSLRIG